MSAADVDQTQVTSGQIRMVRNTETRYAEMASWKPLVMFGTCSLTKHGASVQLYICFLANDIAGKNLRPEAAGAAGKRLVPVLQYASVTHSLITN